MLYIISSRSVTDGVSLSVSKPKLVYSRMIFVDNKLTLIRQLTKQLLAHTKQTVHVCYTQVVLLIRHVLHLEDKSPRRMGRMTQSTILPVTLPNAHRF